MSLLLAIYVIDGYSYGNLPAAAVAACYRVHQKKLHRQEQCGKDDIDGHAQTIRVNRILNEMLRHNTNAQYASRYSSRGFRPSFCRSMAQWKSSLMVKFVAV